ncbi:MAG: transcriptional repressor [Chloroflexi bacterium]|nr:transcriptional repressor [Chloroflexota bacterium]
MKKRLSLALEKLKQHGYRQTPQRSLILEAIERAGGHISAEEIYATVQAKFPEVNMSTVYRTVELLKKLGLVTETDLGEGRVRYHFGIKGHHHHLICQGCGKIYELRETHLTPLRRALFEEYGFEADLRHLAIFGFCRECHG